MAVRPGEFAEGALQHIIARSIVLMKSVPKYGHYIPCQVNILDQKIKSLAKEVSIFRMNLEKQLLLNGKQFIQGLNLKIDNR